MQKMISDTWQDIKNIAKKFWELRQYYRKDEMIAEIWPMVICLIFVYCLYVAIKQGDWTGILFFGTAAFSQFMLTVGNCLIRLRFNEMLQKEEENRVKQESLLEAELSKRGKINAQDFKDLKERIFVSNIALRLTNMDTSNRVLYNVLLPQSSASTSQIDVLMINTHGIFILELKNMAACLSGDGNTGKWLARYADGSEYEVVNAIQQNSRHYDCLRKLLGRQEKRLYKNIVVLGDGYRYDITNIPIWADVIQSKKLEQKVMHLSGYSRGILSLQEVEAYYAQLKSYENPTPEQLQDHIERVRAQ